MLGSVASMAVQTSVIPPSRAFSPCTIQSQKNVSRYGRNGDKPNSQAKKTTSSVIMSAKICNTASPQAAAVSNGPNVDERLKAARERRDQHQKLLASREADRLEREQRARKYYEQQLQQRKKKLLEQRLKEERRRAAVEEKRKQRLREEKERYESAIHRTLERSQRAQQNLAQNTRGRNLTKNAPRRLPLTPWEKDLLTRLLTPTCSYLARSKSAGCQSGEEVSFHSTTTTTTTTTQNKSQQQRSGSASSRTPASPRPSNRTPASPGSNNRTPASPIPSNRTPTSPGSNNRPPASPRPSNRTPASPRPSNRTPASPRPSNRTPASPRPSNRTPVSPRPSNRTPASPRPSNRTPVSPRPSNRTPVSPRPSNRTPVSPGSNNRQHRGISLTQQDISKKNSNSISNSRSPVVNTRVKPAPVTKGRAAPPSPDRTSRRSTSRHPTPLQLELPSVPEEDPAVGGSILSPGNSRPVGTPAAGQQGKNRNPPETPCSNLPNNKTAMTRTAGDGSPPRTPSPPQPPQAMCRPSSGTTDPEEASRLLSEKRREARLQREREEEERLQRQEEERRSREELERRRAEERVRQQAEAQHLIEEKRRREEEEQRRADDERAQAMREALLLLKQREEEQSREKERAEQMRQEREMLSQKEEAARQARKKRLEEIMRRTRRTDSPDTKSVAVKTLPKEAQPKENTQPVLNGAIEDIKLPVGAKTSELGLKNETDVVPVVAFKERRSLRKLTGLEEIQTHQRAEVI